MTAGGRTCARARGEPNVAENGDTLCKAEQTPLDMLAMGCDVWGGKSWK